ncbi:MAG TPA: nucleotidyltransferase domain-containing protein [Thermoanaerobaculia bacterium]|nr:nucleotidyltransferase domain-containing protein [Thermoanaerobaculia bacterium]
MSLPETPEAVRKTLEAFVETTKSAFGDDLRAIVLYGSAAEGRLRATSDVNLVIVLRGFDQEKANALREPFRFAQAAIALNTMFLLESEIADATKEFAQKFADIRRRHVVLYGDDPFASLDIPRADLVRRVQQVLLNLTIRLREMYVQRSLREEQAAVTLAEVAGPLRTSAAAILELEGEETKPPPKEALLIVVGELGRADLAALLPHLSEAREQRPLPAGSAAPLLFLAIELAHALYDRSKRL